MQKTESFKTICPECGVSIHLDSRLHERQLLLCPHCETLLVVTELEPVITVDWAFEEPRDAVPPFKPYFPRRPADWQ